MKTRKAPLVAGLALVAAAFLLPQLWLLSVSLKTKAGVYEYPPRWLTDNARRPNSVAIATQVQTYPDSAKVALLATLLALAVGIPAAYVLSRERFKRREGILGALVAAQMISPVVLLVPIYGLIAALRLLDTHTGLALVYGAVQVPFTIIVLKTFFDALPPSVLEAARLDGASRLLTLRRIALPLVAPGLAATATFNLAAYWSEFALSLVLLDTQSRFTIPIGLFSFQSGYETEWNLVAAASFIGLVPVMAAFALLQRFFVAGLTAGAVKE